MAKARKVHWVRGLGTFIDSHHLEVNLTEGTGKDPTGKKKSNTF
jgi:dihydrolipoamide dehydrogenase